MSFKCCSGVTNTYKHHHIETLFMFRLLDLTSSRSPALLCGRQPPMNSATRTFSLPETLPQLLSTNWIKVDTVACSAISLNIKNIYSSSVRLLIPCAVASYDARKLFYSTLFKKTDTNLENEVQKRTIWTCIFNPVEYLQQSLFTKIVSD